MAELTEKQFVDKIRGKIKQLEKDNVPLKLAAASVHADRIDRIFHRGKKTDKSRIGTYDTTRELWVSDDQLRRAGTHKGKFGDPTKTSYYKNYKELKKQQGFRNTRVNLRMTNNLQSEFANKNIGKNSNSIPSNAEPEKINKDKYVERIDNQEKVDALEEKYGTIFDFSEGEKHKFYKVYNEEASRILES
jgi:hypothetical protein